MLWSDDVLVLKRQTQSEFNRTCIDFCKASVTIYISMQVWNVLYLICTGKLAFLYFFSRHCKAALNSPRPLISDSTDFRGSHGRLLTFASLLLLLPTWSGSSRMVIPATLLVCLLIRVPIIMPILPPVFIPVSLLWSVCVHFLLASFLSHIHIVPFLVFEYHP